jgi:hypothetical protein
MMRARSVAPALALLAAPFVSSAQDIDPPARAGRVSSVLGIVGFQAAGTQDWATTPLNYTVTSGDRLLTHAASRAEIEVGPYDVRLSDSTDLDVINLTDTFTQLGLTRGTIRVSVYRLASRDSMEVDTPNGAMIIRSAGQYRVDVLEGVSTIVSVEDGVAELSGPSLAYTVRRGQSIELTGTNAISANMVPHPRNSEFDNWSADRDRRQENSSCSRYMSRDIPGCADLDRNGNWQYVATYGYVWHPRIVTVGWAPYRYGRWVWSGPWGWTWVESAPWGFAPFHYGRWVLIGGAWAWAPGPIIRRPYYAPALVVFVGGPRHHQAWFPLGWHEPYYPRYRHSDRYLREVNIANVRNITNVETFVDPRRADRISYANRQATTEVPSDVFGRRAITREVANTSGSDLTHAPIVRDRWQGPSLEPRTASPAQPVGAERQSPALRRRDASPAPAAAVPSNVQRPDRAEPEPRRDSPLIYRNSPPVSRRPSMRESGSDPPAPATRERPAVDAPQGLDRERTLIRRSAPPAAPDVSAPVERSRPAVIERRAQPESGERPAPRVSTPSRESWPRESAPRRSAPRESSPRESSPRESSPRSSVPPRESSPSRAPSSGGSSSRPRVSSRRPPTG